MSAVPVPVTMCMPTLTRAFSHAQSAIRDYEKAKSLVSDPQTSRKFAQECVPCARASALNCRVSTSPACALLCPLWCLQPPLCAGRAEVCQAERLLQDSRGVAGCG